MHRIPHLALSRQFTIARCFLILLLLLPRLVSAQTLLHRYSAFNEPNGSLTLTDAVASANGTLQGAATLTGGQVVLNGANGSYVNLPGGLLNGLAAVTIETWADFGAVSQFAYLFSLGATDASGDGYNYIFCAPEVARITIAGVDPGYGAEQNATCAGWSGETNLHVVAIFNPPAGYLAIYTNGILAGVNNAETVPLTSVSNVLSYLGRSLYTADPYAPVKLDEFRLWSSALNGLQAAADYLAGPTVTNASPGTVTNLLLTLAAQMSPGGVQSATVTARASRVPYAVDVTKFSSYSSGNPAILTVSTNGQVTAVGIGTNVIIAQFGGISVTQTVAVINPLLYNLTHRYSFNVDASDSVGGANGILEGNAVVTNGALVLDGVNSYLALPPNLLTNYTAVTMEAWVTDKGSADWARIWDFGSGTTAYMFLSLPSGDANLRGAYTIAGNGNEQILQMPGTGRPVVGQAAHIVWTTDGATGLGILYLNGLPVATNAAMTLTPAAIGLTPNDWLGHSQYAGDPYFDGSIDEFRIYNTALPASLVALDYANGPNGLTLPPNPPQPVASPTNVVFTGATVTLSDSVSGSPPFQYQWESNSVAVTGATNSTLVLSNCIVAFSANYDVVVANGYGTNRSPGLALTVLPPAAPVFLQPPVPVSATNYVGALTTFTATVAGSLPISLQWAHNGTNVPGATSATLTLASLNLADAGNYTLLATNAYGSTSSSPAVLTVLPSPAYAHPSMLTYHGDNTRQAANTNEVLLTLASVNTNNFGKLFSYAVDGYVYTQPLVMTNVTIPGQGVHDVVYIATEHDTVYAFDADSNAGTNGGLLWKTNLGISAVSATATFGGRYTGGGYTDILPEVGATGTPVIDPVSGTLYVNAFTHEGANYIHRVHALDVTTGQERSYSPVVVTASFPGTGVGSVGGVMPFSAVQHNQRPALTLAGGILYVGYAGYADTDPYHGWLIGFNATNLVQLTNYTFNTTPNASTNAFGAHAAEGGIWQGGGGLCVDANTNVYFMSGNGSFSQNTNGGDYADSFLKLSTASNHFAVADYFTPYNQASLASADTDLGSGGPILLPDSAGSTAHPHLIAGCGKQGTMYLLDRDTNMGHFQAASDSQIVQSVIGANNGGWSCPAYFNHLLFYQASSGPMNALSLSNGVLSTTPVSQAPVSFGAFNGGPVISANGNNNAIAWVINSSAYGSSGPGVLYAFNATNLSQSLYNSSQLSARDNPGGAVKMTTPTVTGGKVYVGTEYQLSVYGLQQFLPTPVIAPAGGVFTNRVTITLSDNNPGASIYFTLDGSLPTSASLLYSGPFVLTSNAVVQAIALQTGAISSAVNRASFVNTAEPGNGTGLLGQYYAGTFPNDPFTGPPVVRTDPVVNFNWGATAPIAGVAPTNYTVAWTGCVQAQFSEPYTFYITNDDGIRLYVNGQLLINSWIDQAPTSHSNSITLAGQQLYNLRLEHYQHTNSAVVALAWSSPSTPLAIIPTAQLYPYTNPPPSVVWLSPANNASYTASASVTMSAAADAPYNPLSAVNFYTNGTWLGSVTNEPYTLTATGLGAGNYTLTAVAVDGSGLSSTTAPVNITVTSGSGLPYGLTTNGPVAAFLNLPTTSSGALPPLLSGTGVFSNTTNRTPAAGLLPYAPNEPQWKDNAVSSWLMALPRVGGSLTPGQQIQFQPTNAWTFPAGSVFVKNFDLVVNETNASVPVRRLETELLVRDVNGSVYGVSYKWRSDNSDADLLASSLTENINITNAYGVRTQSWYYASPSDCQECHNTAVGSNPSGINVLGVNARQLNGSLGYPASGVTDNQLRTLNRLGLFNPAFNEAAIGGYAHLTAMTNASAQLVERVRSYLDANCEECHQPGGQGITWDARYDTPLSQQNITNFPAVFPLGISDGACVVKSRDVWRSVLVARLNTLDQNIQMPDFRNLIDSNAVTVITAWINSLPGTPALAPPVISPGLGNYVGSVPVSLTDALTNASIYYTLDGSLPSTNSMLYAGAFKVFTNTMVTASAYASNYDNSIASSALLQVQPLYFASQNWLANGQFQLGFIGVPGSNYVLQATTNFINWIPLSTNQAITNLLNLLDPAASNYPYRFYRVQQP